MLSEITQSEKEKYYMILLICGIWWTKYTNKWNRNRHRYRECADSCQRGGGWGLNKKDEEIKQKKSKNNTS